MHDRLMPLVSLSGPPYKHVSNISSSGPVLMSLRPGTLIANPYPETPADKGLVRQLSSLRFQMDPSVGAVTKTRLEFMEEVEPHQNQTLETQTVGS